MNNSITSKFAFDKCGWPINPATGSAYSRDEIVTSAIPYPLHVDPANPGRYWARRTPADLAPEKRATEKKAKQRQRRQASRRRTLATTVPLAFEQQAVERGRATRDLVERANGEPEARAILVSAGGRFYGVMEVR